MKKVLLRRCLRKEMEQKAKQGLALRVTAFRRQECVFYKHESGEGLNLERIPDKTTLGESKTILVKELASGRVKASRWCPSHCEDSEALSLHQWDRV